ncbi:hypothetical protein TWF281_000102 [Arthrobotrys megalospora]
MATGTPSDTNSPSLLSLPLDIHALLLAHLSPTDIQKLRTLSHASYDLFTSPAICSLYLSLYGIFPEDPGSSKAEFDHYFLPRARINSGKPTKVTVVDGLRTTNFDAPYFTTSHAFQNCGDNVNKSGVVAYRTTAGDLALLDLSDNSRSSVLLITESWELTTQPLAEYNKNGPGVAVMGGIKEKISTGWWSAESLKDKGIGLKKFEVNVHSDFGGEVLFVELAWAKDERATAPYDVIALLQAAHTPPPPAQSLWYPIIAMTKNLGLVISLNSKTFGQPTAVFSLPPNKFPYAEYVLNSHYVAGVVGRTKQFAYIRYARTGMDTVCSLQGAKKELSTSQIFWTLPEYVPEVVQIDLAKMGLVDFQTERRMMLADNLDIHIQPDRAGELAFVITGACVTAFDITRVSKYGGLTILKSFWWRQKDEMGIYIPNDEDLDREETKQVGSWREGMWARSAWRSGCGRKVIAPSLPRIWKSFLPGKTYGGGEGDEEMFTIVRAYNYAAPVTENGLPVEPASREVPAWQRPEFLLAWEIPLTRKGVESYSPQMLNRRAGFGEFNLNLRDLDLESQADLIRENKEGIYPVKIMQLQTALTTNLANSIRCFEAHWALAMQMPQMYFARRDIHKTKPRWLTINKGDITVEGDEYRAIVGPVEKGRWTPERQEDGQLKLKKRQDRVLLNLNRDAKLPCERPYPRTIQFSKRRSGFMSMFWGKGEGSQVPIGKPVVVTELEAPPKGNIHHVKVGDSGNYIAYVINVSPIPTPDFNRFGGSSGGPSGTLVIFRYD